MRTTPSREEVVAGLEALVEHGFVRQWWRDETQAYFIEAGPIYGPFRLSEAAAFVEGFRAAGAGV